MQVPPLLGSVAEGLLLTSIPARSPLPAWEQYLSGQPTELQERGACSPEGPAKRLVPSLGLPKRQGKRLRGPPEDCGYPFLDPAMRGAGACGPGRQLNSATQARGRSGTLQTRSEACASLL